MQQKYDSYSQGGSGGQDFDDIELIISAHSTVNGDLARFFGTQNDWGQSAGLAMENVELEDGGLYLDPEKGKLKTFSWESIVGLSPVEMYEEDGEVLDASEAHDRLSKEYATNTKTYRLIAARVSEVTDPSGDTVIEPSSVARSFEETDDGYEYGDLEDLDGGMPYIADETITWFGADEDYGASTSTVRTINLLAGPGYVADADDPYGFITDTDTDNLLRDDLTDRRVRFFITVRTADESGRDYNYPVFEDLKTGEPVTYDNSGDSGN